MLPLLCYDVIFKSVFQNQENILGKMISDEGMTYQTWIPKHQEKLEQLIEKYTA